ncbi:hypothetical protein [Cytobacillus purgationiresistens]|uniref:hypothetical protein n=1 Tax=Cytobacillus purgationiresistens TaxID=863449 RepID=UPI0027D8458C|nr:hypothetical protein [Cytobacillus purgationiresistens]
MRPRSEADEDDQSPPRGKRAPGEEIKPYLRKATRYIENSLLKKEIGHETNLFFVQAICD